VILGKPRRLISPDTRFSRAINTLQFERISKGVEARELKREKKESHLDIWDVFRTFDR